GVTPNYPNDYHTEIQSIRDNITLDGVDYKLVWTEDVYDFKRIAGAVREEDKRVYFRRIIEQNYQEEVLLYDFNLTVGDTVTVNWMGQQLMVMEESEVEVNGTMRRQLGLGAYSIGYPPTEIDEYWIEGVGSTFGFLNSGSEGMGGAFIYLLCYHENGNLVWDNEAFDDCVMNSDGTLASFAPQGAEWYFDVFNPWGTHPEYQRFFVEGDTIIQGHQCSIIDQRFVDTGHDGGEYVYEEDNKVYWFNPTTNAFTTLYDFDAEAGESWDYEVGDCTHQVIVDSVGSVTWNGHNYRTQWVSYYEDPWVGSSGKGKIIEGVGYEKGLFPSIEVCNGWEVFDASEIEYLRCYVNDGEMLYHEGGYDCDQTTITPPSHPEWYYEILNENGTITYQYMYQAGDTIINDEPTHILVKINTLYDKGLREEVTHEYVFELNGKLYWWNKRTHSFTVLYDYEAEVGDSWNIMVGIEPPLTMTVDAVDYVEYEGRTYRVMHVSDPDDLFSGDIVCGIGHLTSFFPERLMRNADGFRVEGLRCYWIEDELVFNPDGEEECDAIYSEVHGIEEGGPSTPSTGSGTLTVYPNPTNGILTVHHSAFRIHHSEFQIANLMGQTVLSGSITAETMQIDVSNLPEGMYFISIGETTRKFVVR
ncbi:MAG: T9SS type A sorting domain-containing protein, partial [Bacteroidales bacterium]|nr:T9SS type A sorting domain-containing protein [Bacteroidales bacterium]